MIMDIKEIRAILNWTQKEFCKYYGIPLRTLQHWENGDRKPPKYLINIILENLKLKGIDIER